MPEKIEGNVPPQEHMEQEQKIISNFLDNLRTAETIGFFEMRENSLKKEYGVELPENLEELRKACLQKNKTRLETEISSAKTEGFRSMRQTELEEINKRLKVFEK